MLLRSVRAATATAGRRFSATAAAPKAANKYDAVSSAAVKKNIARSTAKKDDAGSAAAASAGVRETLGKRLLSLVHQKRSALVAIRKWTEEGRRVEKFELKGVVRELRKLKRHKHALEICEWMTQQKDMKLNSGDYALHLDLISKVRGIISAEKFFEDLPGPMVDQSTYSTLLHCYVRNNFAAKAEALMEKMRVSGLISTPLPYNHMISLYITNGQLEKAAEVIEEVQRNTSPDVVTFNLWLTVCARQDDVETAEEVFHQLKKANLQPDWVTYSALANLYTKNGLTQKATATLKEMEKLASKKNRAAYSSLLSLRMNIGDKAGVRGVWNKMKLLFRKMSDAEYTCMISSLLKLKELKEAEDLYTEWESVSGTRDSRVPNLLLAAYINGDQMETAKAFYERMSQKGIKASYTTLELLTWGYLKEKQLQTALLYFESAVNSVTKWNPDEKLVSEMFNLVEEQADVEGSERLLDVLREAGHVTTGIYNALLRTYAAAGKMPLLIEERMAKHKVQLDDETRDLIKITNKMCVSEVSSSLLRSR